MSWTLQTKKIPASAQPRSSLAKAAIFWGGSGKGNWVLIEGAPPPEGSKSKNWMESGGKGSVCWWIEGEVTDFWRKIEEDEEEDDGILPTTAHQKKRGEREALKGSCQDQLRTLLLKGGISPLPFQTLFFWVAPEGDLNIRPPVWWQRSDPGETFFCIVHWRLLLSALLLGCIVL